MKEWEIKLMISALTKFLITVIHRSTDDIGARDGGKLLANTAAEAEKYRIW